MTLKAAVLKMLLSMPVAQSDTETTQERVDRMEIAAEAIVEAADEHSNNYISRKMVAATLLGVGYYETGFAQIIAGALEFKKGNTFGVTAFSSYGLFWLTLVFLLILPTFVPSFEAPGPVAMAAYLFMWGLFTFWMFLSTLKLNRALQFIFLTLAILFWLLAIGQFVPIVHTIAGYEGIICGFSAIYTAMAEVMNEVYGRTVLPIGPMNK